MMTKKACTIGLDLGTTSIKAVAFTADEEMIGMAQVHITTHHVTTDSAEQSPDDVWLAVVQVLRAIVSQIESVGYQIAHIGISSAMHSIIAVAEDNALLTQAIIWMDNRASNIADALWNTVAGPVIYSRTGTPIHAMSPLAKILWLQQTYPQITRKARRYVSLKEWIWFRLAGVWQIDASIASATGLYHLQTGKWDEEALALAGIVADQLSEIVATTYTVSGIGVDLAIDGISADTTWTIGASDGVLANLGVGAIDQRDLVLTIGTSSAIRIGSQYPATDIATRIFCYVLDEHRYIVGAPSNNGGIVLEWLSQNLAGTGTIESLLMSASAAHGREILFLPYLAGERAPLWRSDASGSIKGLKIQHTASDIIRGAIEGILFNARWMAEGLPQRPQRLIASGKVLEPAWIRALLADIFQLPVLQAPPGDASAKGAARLARLATGASTWDSICPDEQVEISVPSDAVAWEQHYHCFRAAVDLK